MTIADRARQVGLSKQTLHQWRKDGTDIFSDSEVKARIAGMRSIPAGVAEDFMPCAAPPVAGSEQTTLADLEGRLLACADYGEARVLKAQVSGLRDLIRARREAGELLSKAETERQHFGIGMAMRVAVLALEGTLPPQLEGLAAPAMSKVLRAQLREILTRIADEDREFWPTDSELDQFMAMRR